MHITRRSALLGAVAAGIAASSPVTAETSDPLRHLISDVIDAGDVSTLGTIVASDIAVPDYEIHGYEAFRRASIAAHERRQSQYTEYTFGIEAIATADDWALAYVRFTGTMTRGRQENTAVFYAAQLRDDKIAELYF